MGTATSVRLLMKFNFAQKIRNSGWSESLDLGYADLPTAIAALPNINSLMLDRAMCLGIGPYMVSARLYGYVQPLLPGAAPVRKNSLSIPTPTLPTAGVYNKAFQGTASVPIFGITVDYSADYSTTVYYIDLQTDLSGTPVYRRNYWIAGLPDLADQTESLTITEGATVAAVNKYLASLSNTLTQNGGKNGVSIRSIDRGAGNPVKPCTVWNIGANTYTVPAHGFVQGQPIMAEGMTCIKPGFCPRGRYLVGSVVDVNTITLAGAQVPSTPIHTGGFRAAIVTFTQVKVASPQGFTKRDKGRPSGLSVGRQPRRLTRRA